MNFPEDNNELKLALEKAEAAARLREAPTPSRLCEDWRFGNPHRWAAELVALLEDAQTPNAGSIRVEAPEGVACEPDDELRSDELLMSSIGSDKLLGLHLKRFGKGVCLFLETSPEKPITITYETDSVFTPTTCILAAPGVRAQITERHITRGGGTIFCVRDIKAMEGADISVHLVEEGSSGSRAMNITNISSVRAHVRHLTEHTGHAWAREETTAEILASEDDADIQLFSANRLADGQVLDQHTRQLHAVGRSASNLLYKNVLDGRATTVFAGNIRVEEGAHNTDAYQANRNMLLSEDAVVHSLPGLEILADRVRCSHGSASSPMDEEQLFYLMARGVPRHEAQLLVADGFLEDARAAFRGER